MSTSEPPALKDKVKLNSMCEAAHTPNKKIIYRMTNKSKAT